MDILEAFRSTVVAIKAWADENKVTKVSGKGLSTNDYTNADKEKLNGIESGANKTNIVDNLTEENSGKALDAKQGKILNDKIAEVIDLIDDCSPVYVVQDTAPEDTNLLWIDTSENDDDYSTGQNPPQDGEDGFSPIATVTQTAEGATISITDANGTTTATVTNGKDGKDGTSATHSWNGTVLTVTSASGTSSADLKGAKGDKGDSIKGDPGTDGVSPTVAVSKSGKVTTISITDKNGTETTTINDGVEGSDGENGGYYLPLVTQPESGAVQFGWSASKDGMPPIPPFVAILPEGPQGERGEKGLDATPVTPLFANSISECTDTTKPYVLPDGYIYAYVGKKVEGGTTPNFTNQLSISTDGDGNTYNGKGYKENTYLSSGNEGNRTGVETTGYIPLNDGSGEYVVYLSGITANSSSGNFRTALYRANKTHIVQLTTTNFASNEFAPVIVETGADGNVVRLDYTDCVKAITEANGAVASFIRICADEIDANSIITVNEPIAYTTTEGGTVYEWSNTGHAFVPADYDDRIIAAEENIAENAASIASLSAKTATLESEVAEIKGNGVAVPNGVQAAASALVDKALSRGDSRILRFLISTDAHQDNTNALITKGNRELGQAHSEILKLMGVDFVADLGDITWGATGSSNESVLAEAKAFNGFMLEHLRGQTQIRTEGNHETALLTESQIHGLIYSHNKGLVQDADHWIDGYGYMDFHNQKVRVICLNTDQATGNDTSGVSDTQLKWFAETALNMTGKSDWSVITMSHHPLDFNNITMMKNCMWVLEAFLDGAALDFTTNTGTRIGVDYGEKSCQYVAHFHGHAHAFSTVKLQKWVASETYEELDAWEICIPNACYTRNNQYAQDAYAGQYVQRYVTDTTYNKSDEDGKRTSFNLVTVCLDKRKIYADNYGAGIDRVISYAPGAEEIVTCSIIRNLTNCTSSSSVASVIKGELHDETLAAASGYTMDGATVTVTMGGVDVTDSVYADGALNIANVTGDIIITASAVAANLLVIGQRTFDPMTGMDNLVATNPRDMDYTKIYGGSRDGKRGPYYAGKLATFTLNTADNGFTYRCTSGSGYGPEFPVAMVGGKSYRLRMTSTTRFPTVYLLKFDADGVFVDATRIQPEMGDPTSTVDIITAESGYLYSLHFSLTTANIDITMRDISLVETV